MIEKFFESIEIPPKTLESFNETLAQRCELGIKTYGHPLSTANDRNALQDLREEIVDAMQYLTQAEIERDMTRKALEYIWRLIDDGEYNLASQVVEKTIQTYFTKEH